MLYLTCHCLCHVKASGQEMTHETVINGEIMITGAGNCVSNTLN